MTDISEKARWQESIYQIKRGDEVSGGRNGIANIQASQLADRTRFLKENLDSIRDGKESTFYISDNDPDGTIAGIAGTESGKMFRVAIPDGEGVTVAFNWYKNNNGVALFINSEPSQRYVESIGELINKKQSDTAIDMVDQLGRKSLATNDDGSVETHTFSTKYQLIVGGNDGWVHRTVDSEGNTVSGLDYLGRTHGFFVDHSEKETTPVIVDNNILPPITVNPNMFDGATQTDRVKSALAFLKRRGGGGILELGEDTLSEVSTRKWVMDSALPLHSNLKIYLDKSTLKLADGVFDNILRTDGIVINPDNPNGEALELNETRNIFIQGSGPDEAFIEGPDIPYTAPHPINGGEPVPWVGDWYGWRTIGILLANCKNYELTGFTMRKTTCWGISQERGCDNMYIHDIRFDTTVKNGDGIDFRMGCSNGLVERISGNTSDDTIALTALLDFQNGYPSGNYIWPLQVSGDKSHPLGNDITNIAIRRVDSQSLHNQVRLLITNGAQMHNISVDGVEDTGPVGNQQVIVQTGAYGSPSRLGDMTNITVNEVISNYSKLPLNIDVPIKDSQFNYIRQRKQGGQVYTINNSLPVVNTTITNAKAE